MVAAYNIAVRRLYNPLFERGVSDPIQLARGDFDRVEGFLRESGYKNLYDAISHLQVIADTIDKLQLTEIAIHFEHDAKPENRRHDYISLHDPDRAAKQRKSDDRLPSREAMEAYALCSNNPLSDGEEILLRVIDLLIATGQRGNEVAVIPCDCWVERPIKGTTGELVVDANGNPLVECGIRYFAEKHFQSRVHWLAESDVPLARRAVQRLRALTKEQREIAAWQELHPGRMTKSLGITHTVAEGDRAPLRSAPSLHSMIFQYGRLKNPRCYQRQASLIKQRHENISPANRGHKKWRC